MIRVLSILLLALTCLGQWVTTTWDAYSGHFNQTTNFVVKNKSTLFYTSFVTQPVDSDFVDQTLTCATDIHATPFVFRGQGVWNNGPLPAHVRLYFTSTTNTYSNIDSSQHPNLYWWSTNWIALNLNDCMSFSTIVSPENFANGGGQSGSLDTNSFYACASNVKQIGFAFGGGSFYDVGVASTLVEALLDPDQSEFQSITNQVQSEWP